MIFSTAPGLIIFVIIALVILLITLFNIHIRRRIIKTVGHPPLWPILGNGLMFTNNTPSGILKLIGSLLEKYGKRFQVLLGTDLVLFTADVKDFEVQLVLNVLVILAFSFVNLVYFKQHQSNRQVE